MRLHSIAGLVLSAALVWASSEPVFAFQQLDPDDYRYIARAAQLEADFAGNFPDAVLVENRWDHLWWMDTGSEVRFVRPSVVLSFWLDRRIWGDSIEGHLLTNVLLELACCLLAVSILLRILGPGLPALASGLLFSAFACHAETVWYLSGRTDTLAALGFFLGFALHVHAGGKREWPRYLALPAYAFAIVSKELTLTLPIFVLLHDLWIEKRGGSLRELWRRDYRLHACYAGLALAYLAFRQIFIAARGGSSLVFPYFVSPASPGFPGHVLTQLSDYALNLFGAGITKPFLQATELPGWRLASGLALAAAAVLVPLLLLPRERRLWLLLLVGLLTWLPTSVVYVSERYLFLPSFALAGVVGLVLSRLRAKLPLYLVMLLASGLWISHQFYWLRKKNEVVARIPREPVALELKLRELGLSIARGGRVLFLNFPGNWVHAQFFEDQLRVLYRDPGLECRILSLMPVSSGMARGLELERVDARTLRVSARGPLLDASGTLFPWVRFEPGTRIQGPRLGFSVEVIAGSTTSSSELLFRFREPLDSYVLLHFVPPAAAVQERDLPPGHLILQGKLRVVKP
ncbi:MAG: hypothetical protein ACE5F1_09960 [Planctomycetota bacterium]